MKANKILVPLDGSEMAEAAIAPAREMAQAGSVPHPDAGRRGRESCPGRM